MSDATVSFIIDHLDKDPDFGGWHVRVEVGSNAVDVDGSFDKGHPTLAAAEAWCERWCQGRGYHLINRNRNGSDLYYLTAVRAAAPVDAEGTT